MKYDKEFKEQAPQYYVENTHPAIIDSGIQLWVKGRTGIRGKRPKAEVFFIILSHCVQIAKMVYKCVFLLLICTFLPVFA